MPNPTEPHLPWVSIVIPAYNHATYLDQAVQSILKQDYNNVELIVLDDGSTDNTLEVLSKYEDLFFWESQQNMGQANTLNKGWRMAKGEILGFISADDALLPGAVSKAVDCLKSNPDAVLSYSDFNLIDADSRVIRRVRTPEFSYDNMVVKITCPPGPGAFFRRSAFEVVGLWDNSLKIMLDYDYWLRLGLIGRFVRIPEVLAQYRVHDSSQTFAGVDESKAREPVLIISRLFDTQPLPQRLLNRKSEALSNAHLVNAQLDFRAGRCKLGYANLRRAFSLHPRNLFTLRAARLMLNALFNRFGHRILWRIKHLLGE